MLFTTTEFNANMASFSQKIVMRTSEFIARAQSVIRTVCNILFHNQHLHNIPYIPVPELVDVLFEASETYKLAVVHHTVQIPPAA